LIGSLAALGVGHGDVVYAATLEPHQAGPSIARPVPGIELTAGLTAYVNGDGDCLRLRAEPGLNGARIACIPDGSPVLVREGTVHTDGHTWQLVEAGGLTGWVASEYLATAPPAPTVDTAVPAASACGLGGSARAFRPGLGPGLALSGGLGLAVWGGGTVQGVTDAAALSGQRLEAAWATRQGVGFVGYLVGAPQQVNVQWLQLFPGGRIPAGTPLILRTSSAAGLSLAPTDNPVPQPRPSTAPPTLVTGTLAPAISATAAILIDDASGAVLYEHGAHRALAPASLTKIASAIVAIEGADLDGWVASDVDATAMPLSSVMGLVAGDCFTLRDMLYGLMLPSGNDAALAVGRHVSGSDARFVESMNLLLARLGLRDSHFSNAHGLDEQGHIASAYDLAMLARYGMTLPEFATTVTAPAWTASGGRQIELRNVNRFLSLYAGADGVKTGFTEDAGRTLIASASRNGHRLYAVLLNAPVRFDDAAALMDWAFANHRWP
jgi:D-alanyl-D-alanine carboxypeptidase